VLAITSKVISLSEGQVVPKTAIEKTALVKQESDQYLGEVGYGCHLTVKHGLFIPSAGIDESNAEGDYYILFPKDPYLTAHTIRDSLAREWGLINFGVIITDSHTSPLRAGVTGITLAHSGFKGIENKVGTPDLFGRPLKMTRINAADALSTTAVYCMGESNECTPLAILRSTGIVFEREHKERKTECAIPPEEDLYFPLYRKNEVRRDA